MLWPGFSGPKKGPDFDRCHLVPRRQICSVLNVYAAPLRRTSGDRCSRRDVERALAGVRSARVRPASGSRRLAQSRDSLSQGFSLSKYSACLCKTPIGGQRASPSGPAMELFATSAHSKLRIASAGEVPRCREDAPHRVIIQGLAPFEQSTECTSEFAPGEHRAFSMLAYVWRRGATQKPR